MLGLELFIAIVSLILACAEIVHVILKLIQ